MHNLESYAHPITFFKPDDNYDRVKSLLLSDKRRNPRGSFSLSKALESKCSRTAFQKIEICASWHLLMILVTRDWFKKSSFRCISVAIWRILSICWSKRNSFFAHFTSFLHPYFMIGYNLVRMFHTFVTYLARRKRGVKNQWYVKKTFST